MAGSMSRTCSREEEEVGETAVIEVDGGVKTHNATAIATAVADILVAGSAVFGGEKSIAQNIADLRKAVG